MKKLVLYLMMISSVIYFSSCNSTADADKDQHDHSSHDHDHDHVHDDGDDHDHDEGDDSHQTPIKKEETSNIIEFTSEQAKNVLDFKVETIKKQTFYEILKTSGQILSAPGDEVVVSATTNGIVNIVNSKLTDGVYVNSGSNLFNISGKDLSENNSSTKLNEAKAFFENVKTEYERGKDLVGEKIISEREFQQIKLTYDQAKLNYQTLSKDMSGNGKHISTPMSGYIKSLLVQSGQYVEMGQPLAVVTQNKQLILRADVSQRYIPIVKDIKTASFTTPYDNKTYDLSDFNGKLVSIGRNSGENTFYTPVNFEFDNRGHLVVGSFVEVYLKSQPIADAIVLPITALIEEQGHYFVYIQLDHEEDYMKKEVRVGASDGTHRQVLEGLQIGQKIVSNGAYALKMASMSGDLPHGHEH